MKPFIIPRVALLAVLGLSQIVLIGAAQSALPAPTPQQQQAAAEKKAKADAQAAEEKRQLAESMETLADRWRKRAGSEGWRTHPPVPVTAAKDTPSTPAPPAATPPIKSEKSGTAAPSEDVKPDKPVSIR